jgi:biopolymer transport protein ExbD
MRKRVRRGEETSDVNVTPLLDIVFIMLIFFIVTATFVYEDGLEPNLPPPTPPEEEQKSDNPLVFTVLEDGFVQVDGGRLIDAKSVRAVAGEFLASKPRGVIIVSATPDSESGIAVTVLDQARLANRSAGGTGTITITKTDDE